MKRCLLFCAVFVLLVAGVVSGATPQENSARVTVTGFSVDPAVLMPGDAATVTVTVTNAADGRGA